MANKLDEEIIDVSWVVFGFLFYLHVSSFFVMAGARAIGVWKMKIVTVGGRGTPSFCQGDLT